MAPYPEPLDFATIVPKDGQAHSHLYSRNLSHPNHTQAVTLGVIAAYAVAIAILWNVPYLRNILWPFKVCMHDFWSGKYINC